MDAFRQLRREAREKRDKALSDARAEYRATLQQIAVMERRLRQKTTRRRRRSPRVETTGPYTGFSVAKAVELILAEGGAWTLTELAIEIQKRGCRSGDDPRAVAKAARGTLNYYGGRFEQRDDGAWRLSPAYSSSLSETTRESSESSSN